MVHVWVPKEVPLDIRDRKYIETLLVLGWGMVVVVAAMMWFVRDCWWRGVTFAESRTRSAVRDRLSAPSSISFNCKKGRRPALELNSGHAACGYGYWAVAIGNGTLQERRRGVGTIRPGVPTAIAHGSFSALTFLMDVTHHK